MIRINLLGRSRPKAVRASVPLEDTLQYVLGAIALLVSIGALYGHYRLLDQENTKYLAHIQKQTGEKARLEHLKAEVVNFQGQKIVLQQKIGIIEGLQRNRTGGQELLDAIANTVSRSDTVWLVSVERRGNGLNIRGSAGSINAVANYITQLKRSGFFQGVEIRETHQDPSSKGVELFVFNITADFAPLPPGAATPAANAPQPAGKAGKT